MNYIAFKYSEALYHIHNILLTLFHQIFFSYSPYIFENSTLIMKAPFKINLMISLVPIYRIFSNTAKMLGSG